MNASPGVEPASAQEPAVVGMPVVPMLSFTMIGIPSSGRRSPWRRALSAARASARAVGLVGDHGVELRVQLLDPVEVELGQLDRRQPVPVHQRLELRDRRPVDVDAGHLRVAAVAWPRTSRVRRRPSRRAAARARWPGARDAGRGCASQGPPLGQGWGWAAGARGLATAGGARRRAGSGGAVRYRTPGVKPVTPRRRPPAAGRPSSGDGMAAIEARWTAIAVA